MPLQVKKMFVNLLICCIPHVCTTYNVQHSHAQKTQKVLLITLDGFRWDLRNKTSTPNLDWIVEHGISTEYVQNVFPTNTLPNHYSIVTGLYPEHHGMIANEMFDAKTNETFSLDFVNETTWWNQATPIWIDNELQGHESGVCFWPGYHVVFNGTKAKYTPSEKYTLPFSRTDNIMPFQKRLALVVDWLKKKNVTFVALHIEKPDTPMHSTGPDRGSAKLNAAIQEVDEFIGKLRQKLKNEKLTSQVNVLIMGDHGQINLSYRKQVSLKKYIDLSKYAEKIVGFTSVMIYARPGYKKLIYNKLENAKDHFKVYLKENIPERYHIKRNNRTADILIVGEPGWAIFSDIGGKVWFRKNSDKWEVGDHGYSNYERSMNPAFFGFGPSLKSDYRKKSVELIDFYELMCHILKIKPRKNDGKFNRVKNFLKEFL